MKLESFFFLGVPFFVFSKDELDLAKMRTSIPKIQFMFLFGSIRQFLKSVKDTGKIIYGKDLLRDVKLSPSFSDKLKLFFEPFYFLSLSMIVLPFDRKLAMKHAMKISLYEEEFDMFLLGKKMKGYNKDFKNYKKFVHLTSGTKHLEKTLKYRKNYNKMRPMTGEAFSYILGSYRFVIFSWLSSVRN